MLSAQPNDEPAAMEYQWSRIVPGKNAADSRVSRVSIIESMHRVAVPTEFRFLLAPKAKFGMGEKKLRGYATECSVTPRVLPIVLRVIDTEIY